MNLKQAYRVALICGAFPLLVGVSIFLLWLITRWNWLKTAGVFTIGGGTAIFFVGALALGRYCWLAFRTPDRPGRRLWLSTLGCAALLLSNFVVAAIITETVIAIQTRYTVTVHNASPKPLSGVQVFGGGCEADFGTILPDASVKRSFWIRHDGQLEFRSVSGATTHTNSIDGYVARHIGGQTTVTIKRDGTMAVSHE